MNKEPIISTIPDGKFTLRPIKESTSLPGITRKVVDNHIEVNYQSRFALYSEAAQMPQAIVQEKTIRTDTRIPKLGVMLVGLGGNNGSTFTAGVLANRKRLSWATKAGESSANFYGSFT